MTWLRAARHAGALAILVLAAACAPAASLTDAWLSESYDGPPFHKVIVLAASADGATRRNFEDSFAAALTASGVQAVTGYDLFPGDQPPSPDDLRQAVRRVGADGALVTRLLAVEQRTRTSPGHVRSAPGWGARGGFYRTAIFEPPRTTTYDVARLQTDLWSLQGEGTLVWSGMSRAVSPRDAGRVGGDLAGAVVEELRAGGLVAQAPAH